MTDTTALIEELFCQGNRLEDILRAGPDNGWTRDDVMAVLQQRQWDLDGSGRLPRSKRNTLPRGLRGLPPVPARTRMPCSLLPVFPLAPATAEPVNDVVPGEELTAPADPVAEPQASGPAPSPTADPAPATYPAGETATYPVRSGDPLDDGPVAVPDVRPIDAWAEPASTATPVLHTVPAPEPAPAAAEPAPVVLPAPGPRLTRSSETRGVRATSGRDLDEWLAASQESPHPTVRRRASTALVALLQLRVALDELARAERTTT